jgi:hypothetical protein
MNTRSAIRYLIPLEELKKEELTIMNDQLFSVKALTDPQYFAQIEALIRDKELELKALAEAQRWQRPAKKFRNAS